MGLSVYIRQAIENGKVIFPGDRKIYGFCKTCDDHKPGDKLKCLECNKKQRSAFGFAAQYMNNPVDEDAIEFKTAWIQEAPITGPLASDLQRQPGYLTVDPALRLKESTDPSGFVVTKMGSDNLVYVLEAFAKKTDTQDVINEIFRLVDMYNISTIGIETVGAQLAILNPLKKEMQHRRHFIKVDELKTSTKESKAVRIRGLIPYYANGQIVHRQGLIELKEQLMQFPRNLHDDIIDALAYQIGYWREHKPGMKGPKNTPYMSVDWFHKQSQASRMDQLFKEYKRR